MLLELSGFFMEWLLLLGIGFIAGIAAGLLGIGGGLILVPALSWVLIQHDVPLDLAATMAVATALAVIVFTALSSIRAHHRRGAVRWLEVKIMAPWIALGAGAGAVLGHFLGGRFIIFIFALFAILLAWRMYFQSGEVKPSEHELKRPKSAAFGIGLLSALVGIGGGSMTVPYFRSHGLAMVNAIANGAALGYPIAVASALTYIVIGWQQDIAVAHLGYVYWPGLLVISVTSVAAAPLGASLAHKWPTQVLARIFAMILLIVAIKMLWELDLLAGLT